MVLPSSPPPDAYAPPADDWIEPITTALALSRRGILMLVGSLAPWGLGDLVRALLPEHPEIDVYRDVRVVETLPIGSKLILVPRREDAPALNMARPIFARRELKVILACDRETSEALLKDAPDFFDWISIYVEWPKRPVPHAVHGLRRSREVGAPGIVWIDWQVAVSEAPGSERLKETLEAVLPHRKLVLLDIHARFEDILSQIDTDESSVPCVDTSHNWYFRRMRWAFSRHSRRALGSVFVATTEHDKTAIADLSPWFCGYAPVHDRIATFEQGHAMLARAGARYPGRLAALLAYEPEAILLCTRLLENGESEVLLSEGLSEAGDPGAFVARMAFDRAILRPEECDLNRASPPIFRALATRESVLRAVGDLDDPIVLDRLDETHAALHALHVGDYEVGRVWGERALEKDERARTNAELLFGLGTLRLEIGDHDHAWSLLREAARCIPDAEDPLYVPCVVWLIRASVRARKWYQAKATAGRAIAAIDADLGAQDPGIGRLMLSIAEIYRREGHLLVAGFILKRLLHLDLADENFSADEAETVVFEYIDKNFRKAAPAIAEWWATAPPTPEDDLWCVLAELGEWHLQQGQAKEAGIHLEQAWALATQQFATIRPGLPALLKSLEYATRVMNYPGGQPEQSTERQKSILWYIRSELDFRLDESTGRPVPAPQKAFAALPPSARSTNVQIHELSARISKMLRHRVDPSDIEDLENDILLRLMLRGGARWLELPWKDVVYAIADIVKKYRYKQRIIRTRRTDVELDEFIVADDSINEDLEYRDVWNAVALELSRLRHADRRILGLYYFEGRTLANIAAELGITRAAASARLQRAMEELRRRLGADSNPFA